MAWDYPGQEEREMSRGSTSLAIRLTISALVLAGLASACEPDEPQSAKVNNGTPPCERADALSAKVGCAPLKDCAIDAACTEVVNTFVDCVERDLTQCKCDGDARLLDCEGAFQPEDGPARCVNEATAMHACTDP